MANPTGVFPFSDNSHITVGGKGIDGKGMITAFHEVTHRGTGATVRLEQDREGALHVVGTQADGSRFIDVVTRHGPVGETN